MNTRIARNDIEGGIMRIWARYLIIGWSIVTLAIVIVTFQLMKSHFIEEDYEVTLVYKTPEKVKSATNSDKEWEIVAESLFFGKDVFDTISITKKEFIERIKKAKSVTIESKNKVKDTSVYLFFPIYAFIVWSIPVLVFSLIGLLFSRKNETRCDDKRRSHSIR